MDITVDSKINHPRAVVYAAMRDQMASLAPYLPNVERIEVRERKDTTPGVVELVNFWKAAATEIPAVARPFIDPSKLSWIDRARWVDADQTCHWSLEVSFMPERVKCSGTTTYLEDGPNRTAIRMRGKLEFDLKGLLPGLIARTATPSVEQFVVKMIQPNLEKTVEALGRFLDTGGRAG
jgi:hypothetical protein